MQTFEQWLDERYPGHSAIGDEDYDHWKWSQRVAYIAGWEACRDKWGGMSYVETINNEAYNA